MVFMNRNIASLQFLTRSLICSQRLFITNITSRPVGSPPKSEWCRPAQATRDRASLKCALRKSQLRVWTSWLEKRQKMKHCLCILCGCRQSPGPLGEDMLHQTGLDDQNFTLARGVGALGISGDTSELHFTAYGAVDICSTRWEVIGKRGWGRTRGMIGQVHVRPCMWGAQVRVAQAEPRSTDEPLTPWPWDVSSTESTSFRINREPQGSFWRANDLLECGPLLLSSKVRYQHECIWWLA